MTNLIQLNKRAVRRFTALFICMLLICGIALPLFVFADSFYSFSISINSHGNSSVSYNDNVDFYLYFNNTPYHIDKITYSWSSSSVSITFYSNNISIFRIWASNTNVVINTNRNGTSETILNVNYSSSYFVSSSLNINGNSIYFNSNITLRQFPILFEYSSYSIGYTLSFNSQGGSSISPLTGVSGIVHLGESGQYYPQYVPTLYGYDFVGWSLTENGTILFDVDIQSDTVLYARWSIQSQYVSIRFGDGFYEDSSCTDDLAGYFGVKGESLTFYAKKKLYQYTDITYDPLEHFYGSIHYSIGTVGYDMEGEMISGTDNPTEERIYKYTLYLDDSYYIQVNSAPLYKCWFRFNTTDYQEFNTGINYVAWYGQTFAPLWYRETNSYLYITDSYLGMDLEVWIRLPYIINKPVVFDPAALLDEDYDQQINYDLRFSEDIVEDNTAYGATIHYHIIANPFQSQETLEENEYVNIILLGKAISDYDITDEYSAIIVYDENSNASWAFSEVELLDTDWSEVNENIPTKLNSFFGGLFSLSGLAVLIPMVMMVSFAIWFIRRS